MTICLDSLLVVFDECRPFFMKFGVEGGTFLAKQPGVRLVVGETDRLLRPLFGEGMNKGRLGSWGFGSLRVMIIPPSDLLV